LASEPKGLANAIIRQGNSNHRHFPLINCLWSWVPKHNSLYHLSYTSLHSVTPDDWMFQFKSSKPTRHRFINIHPFYFFYVATTHFEKPKSLCQVVSISLFWGIMFPQPPNFSVFS